MNPRKTRCEHQLNINWIFNHIFSRYFRQDVNQSYAKRALIGPIPLHLIRIELWLVGYHCIEYIFFPLFSRLFDSIFYCERVASNGGIGEKLYAQGFNIEFLPRVFKHVGRNQSLFSVFFGIFLAYRQSWLVELLHGYSRPFLRVPFINFLFQVVLTLYILE